MKSVSPLYIFALLVTLAFTLATSNQLRVERQTHSAPSEGAFTRLLGEGRRLFAGQFIELADVYLHSGVYPSIFDRTDPSARKAIAGPADDHADHDEHAKHDEHDDSGHADSDPDDHDHRHELAKNPAPAAAEPNDRAMNFLGKPANIMDAFIRRFRVTAHTHLAAGEEREVLPWLQVAIELDPQAVETYTMAAYWLSKQLHNDQEAEKVLREGIRNNPQNPELLLEMGQLYQAQNRDADSMRNIWLLALRRWTAQTEAVKAASPDVARRILEPLGKLESSAGNFEKAIAYLELAKPVSPNPQALQHQIDDLRTKLGGARPAGVPPVP